MKDKLDSFKKRLKVFSFFCFPYRCRVFKQTGQLSAITPFLCLLNYVPNYLQRLPLTRDLSQFILGG